MNLLSYSNISMTWILMLLLDETFTDELRRNGRNTTDDSLYIIVDSKSEIDITSERIYNFLEYYLDIDEASINFVSVIHPFKKKVLRISTQDVGFFEDNLKTLMSLNSSITTNVSTLHSALLFTTETIQIDNARHGREQSITIACVLVCYEDCQEIIHFYDKYASEFDVKILFFFLYPLMKDPKMLDSLHFDLITEHIMYVPLRGDNLLAVDYLVLVNKCIKCPIGRIIFRRNLNPFKCICYKINISPVKINWNDASKQCSVVSSSLPVIETNEELLLLKKILNNARKSTIPRHIQNVVVHVGLNKTIAGLDGLRWTNGNPFIFRNNFKLRNDNDTCLMFSSSLHEGGINKTIQKIDADTWELVDCTLNITEIVLCETDIVPTTDINSKPFHDGILIASRKILTLNKEFSILNNFIYSISNRHYSVNLKDNDQYAQMSFDCDEHWSIEYSRVCNNYLDCLSLRDEFYCQEHLNTMQNHVFLCENPNAKDGFPFVRDIPIEKKCDSVQDCPDNSDEAGCDECIGRRCSDGTCVPRHWLSHDKEECQLFNRNDGSTVIYYVIVGNIDIMNNQHEVINCNQFMDDWAPKCIFLRGRSGQQMGCKDMSHLQDCSRFDCSDKFVKCWESYCIPSYLVNDGIRDCPHGEDENNFDEVEGYFLCNSGFTIRPVEVCDGFAQCPDDDDELNCNVTCPLGFKCFGNAVRVYNKSEVMEVKSLRIFDIKTKSLKLNGLDLSQLDELYILPNLMELLASNCNLKSLDYIFSDTFVMQIFNLDLSHNKLTKIDLIYHNILPNLHFIILTGNTNLDIKGNTLFSKKIQKIDLSFTNISDFNFNIIRPTSAAHLIYLNVSNTKIEVFETPHLIISLDVLDIRNTSLNDKSIVYVLNTLTITSALYVDNFKYCCPQVVDSVIPKHICHAPNDDMLFCKGLIGDILKRSLLCFAAFISLVGNMLVLTFRITYDRAFLKNVYGVFVTNLKITDFIMGVYLTIIFLVDIYFRDKYVIYEEHWRASILCSISGLLSTLSIETSTFFVLFITLDRFLIIRFPFGEYRLTKLVIVLSVATSWVIGFTLALIPIVYQNWTIYSSNGMCLGLPLTSDRMSGSNYSFGVFIVFNLILFLAIAMGQVLIFMSISSLRIIMDTVNPARREQDIKIAKQLFIVACSNFLCWFPIFITGLLSRNGLAVSPDIYTWFVLFVLPLNAVFNTMVYFIPAIHKKWMEFNRVVNPTVVLHS